MIGIGTETAFEAASRARALAGGGPPDGPPLAQPRWREAFADESKRCRGIDVDPANVVVTPGAKPIMYYAILALIEPGDEVVYPDPGFPIYESMTRFTGGTPVPYALREENDFRFDV